MKIGYQTISWGTAIDDIEYTLRAISDAGYAGVEFAQRPDSLGVANANQLIAALEQHKLEFTGLVGGTITERLQFLDPLPHNQRPQYLYVEPWELATNLDTVNRAVHQGYILAIHPRVFSQASHSDDIRGFLQRFQFLNLILDSAHAYLADNYFQKILHEYHDRVVSVHIKDWTPDNGRSIYRYARGFSVLGTGEVPLFGVLDALEKSGYAGWLIAELDNPVENGPLDILQKSSQWLQEHSLLKQKNKPAIKSIPQTMPPADSVSGENAFRKLLLDAATGKADDFYSNVVRALECLGLFEMITVSAYTSSDKLAIRSYCTSSRIRSSGLLQDLGNYNLLDSLSGIAIYRQAQVTHFDLRNEHPGAPFGAPFDHRRYRDPRLALQFDLNTMISVPVFNSGNPNTVRLLVNLFPAEDTDIPPDKKLAEFSMAITQASDAMMDRLCYQVTMKVNHMAGKHQLPISFLENLVRLITESVPCEATAIFLVDETEERLFLDSRLTTGTHWYKPENEQYYSKTDKSLTGRAWTRRETIIKNARHEPGHEGKSTENMALIDLRQKDVDNYNIWVPLMDAYGKIIGVIRCLNRRSRERVGSPSTFSFDDATLLDAIVQASAAHISALHRMWSVKTLMHEIRNPLTGIRASCDKMMEDYNRNPSSELQAIWHWSELMKRLMTNISYSSYWPTTIRLHLEDVEPEADIIRPVKDVCEWAARTWGIRSLLLTTSGFEKGEKLRLDQGHFQQVFFNLIKNSVDHRDAHASDVKIEVAFKSMAGGYNFFFRDWGPGVSEYEIEDVFREGYQSEKSNDWHPIGDGLGLFVVRKIVKAHHGTIQITSSRQPLEFTIYVPDRRQGDR